MDDEELWDKARALKKAAKAEIKHQVSASARLPLLCCNNLRSEDMPFAELTKPRASWSFWIWKVLVDINFARTWTWCDQTEGNKERVTRLVSLHIVQREIEGKVQSAFTLILGPLKVMAGLAT